jgi:hypothetical protein
MTDQSSRNSALHQSVNSHHDSYVGSGAGATGFHGQGEPKAEYYVPGDAAGFSSAGARNLALDRSEVSTPRHMSVRYVDEHTATYLGTTC